MDPALLRARYDRATADLDPPLAVVDLAAFHANASDLARRARGRPVRVASKSVRCRHLVREALTTPGFRGVMAFTLAEALWLVGYEVTDDALVAYPTADRGALVELAADPRFTSSVTLMVDDPKQLDLIDDATGPHGTEIRVCLDVDSSFWMLGGRVRLGARRSPLHSPEEAAAVAREIADRRGFRLVGLMAYEAQIAGVGDKPPGRAPGYGMVVRALRNRSAAELAERRAAVVEAVRQVAPLEFVNGGGTGSLESTAAETAVTEVTAGSGLYAPTLFDTYRAFRHHPAALFALPVVRRPSHDVVTVAGGGFIASGPAGADRLPQPYLPAGLRLDNMEGAGEVQTPVRGLAAHRLAIGDRVWFRHAKAASFASISRRYTSSERIELLGPFRPTVARGNASSSLEELSDPRNGFFAIIF